MWDTSPILKSTRGVNQLTTDAPSSSKVGNLYNGNSSTRTLNVANEKNLLNGFVPLPVELRKYEHCRLKSFNEWPASGVIDPKKLAKVGFFWTGSEDAVECFSCGVSIKNWESGDNVLIRHKDVSPECLFINVKSNNVPLNTVTSSVITSNSIDQSVSGANQYVDNRRIYDTTSQVNAPIPVAVSDQRQSAMPDVVCGNNGESFNRFGQDDIDIGGNQNVKSPASRYQSIDQHKYKKEEERLKSFKYGWPCTFIDPKELAHIGFYYTLSQDKVECAFCHGIVSHWEAGDDPLTEHAKHFPRCPFLMQMDVGNVPLRRARLTDQTRSKTKGEDVAGIYSLQVSRSAPEQSSYSHHRSNEKKNDAQVKLEELGIISQQVKPRYPSQAVLDARIRSFKDPNHPWPTDSPVSAESLAIAGFFYSGIEDRVRCFHCNGGLSSWVSGDDPWIEHARWFPKCNYVKLNKGDLFIKDARQTHPPVVAEQLLTPDTEEVAKLRSRVEELMNSSVVEQFLEMGISETFLRDALREQLSTTGAGFSSASELYDAVQDVMSVSNSVRSSPVPMRDIPPSAQPIAPCELHNGIQSEIEELGQAEAMPGTSTADLTLEEENRKLKEQKMCKICMDQEIGVVFLPCGHLISCPQCAPALTDCPMCRKTIKGTVRTYLS